MLNFETLLQYNPITINGYVQAWNVNSKIYVTGASFTRNSDVFNYTVLLSTEQPVIVTSW